MLKIQILERLLHSRLVVIIRSETPEQAIRTADACVAGGVGALEVTFTTPSASSVIACLKEKYKAAPLLIGAGSVIDPETARIAMLAGAEFIVAPALSEATARLCNRYQIPYIPGASTVKEIVDAMEAGASIVKIFPGETLGPEFIKAVRGPIPQAPMMPTGGVTVENAKEWLDAGCVAIGVGSSLTAGAKSGDYSSVTAMAEKFMRIIRATQQE